MVIWGRKVLPANVFMVLVVVIMTIGLPACSGQEGSVANPDSRNEKAVGNGQDDTEKPQESQEAQPTDMPTPDASVTDAGESHIISGTCGENAVWSYDTGSKLLQITGTGVVDKIIRKSEEYVSEYGFKKRYQVKEIRVGEGITALAAGPLFLNVSKAKGAKEIQVSLPDSLEKIGADTFDPGQPGAEYVRRIHLPRSVRYIEGGAFWGIGDEASPEAYSYKENVELIAAKYKNKLEISVDSKNPYYTVKDGVLFTKDFKTLVYYPSEKTNQAYHIPKSVTRIKALAFARNSFLKKVVLPEGLKEIGAGAFFNNQRLTEINLEQAKKLKRICDFNGRKYKISLSCWTGAPVGTVVPEESDEEYHNPAEYRKDFYGSSRVRMDYYFLGTFAGTNLKSIQFPERLKYVSYNTFKNCLHLKKISIGESYSGEINPDRICDRKGFSLPDLPGMDIQVPRQNKHYVIKNNILYSKDGKTVYKALKSYHNITLVLDRNVRKIAREAFSGISRKKLQKVVVLGSLAQISSKAFAVSGIKSFEVYGNVDTVGIEAFYFCSGLQKFICHGTVKNIGAQAFYYDTDLAKVSFGNHVKSIGKGAFAGCNGIKNRIKTV